MHTIVLANTIIQTMSYCCARHSLDDGGADTVVQEVGKGKLARKEKIKPRKFRGFLVCGSGETLAEAACPHIPAHPDGQTHSRRAGARAGEGRARNRMSR